MGSGARGHVGLYWEASEYSGAIHIHQAYPIPLTGVGETPRGNGGEVVVVTAGDESI